MWNFDGRPVDPENISLIRKILEPHAPDGFTIYADKSFVMLYGALHISEESRRERQPFTSGTDTFILWDGRLDNRTELRRTPDSNRCNDTDLPIVACAWQRDGIRCLGKLIGDWALSVFNLHEGTLLLAKDFLGTRRLYYFRCHRYVAWSSLLAPLIALAGKLTVCEEYLAGWLAGFPEAQLTPYREIHAVPPASFVSITRQAATAEPYWNFQSRPIHLKSDAEYEEQFRVLFFESVRRRLRSAAPVLAELSGGMDSSAIVCAADRLASDGSVPPVETASFFDDSEPNWNERPFFAAVEMQRAHTGFHLNVSGDGQLLPDRDGILPVTPAHGARLSESQTSFYEFLSRGGFRVLLSGIGGDEFTGGVPTGIPELADLFRRGSLSMFVRRAFLWSLSSRKPLFHIFGKTLRSFLPTTRTPWSIPWVKAAFLRCNGGAFGTRATRFRWFGPSPTFQENLHALDGLRRQIACAELSPLPSCEKRYPFLDRDLLEFLFNVPREQLVGPNQRRSLLRRALRGIVPDMVLDRRSKAFPVTNQLKAFSTDWKRISQLVEKMSLESHGVIDPKVLARTLDEARRGEEVPLLSLTRVLRLEWWMQDAGIQRLLSSSRDTTTDPFLNLHADLVER